MHFLIPKQHGAWAMLFIPFLLGVFGGKPVWSHFLLLFAWFFLYLSTYPLSLIMKKRKVHENWKWFSIYSILALLLLVYPVWRNFHLIYFGLSMVPFFLITLYFAKIKKDRALINDIVAVIIFSIGALASYYYGTNTLDPKAWFIFLTSFLYFLGTIFYVKTMIRERKNILYKYVSWTYHIGLILIFLLLGEVLLAIAYLPCTIRAILLYGKNVHIKIIGAIEIFSAIFFFAVMLFII